MRKNAPLMPGGVGTTGIDWCIKWGLSIAKPLKRDIAGGGGVVPSYEQYWGVLAPSFSERGYRFWPFWSDMKLVLPTGVKKVEWYPRIGRLGRKSHFFESGKIVAFGHLWMLPWKYFTWFPALSRWNWRNLNGGANFFHSNGHTNYCLHLFNAIKWLSKRKIPPPPASLHKPTSVFF